MSDIVFKKKIQQFPLMTRESYMTVAVASSYSVSTLGFRLLK